MAVTGRGRIDCSEIPERMVLGKSLKHKSWPTMLAAALAPRRGQRWAAGLTLPRREPPEFVKTHTAFCPFFRPTPHTARSSCHPTRFSLCLSIRQRYESEMVPNTAL